MNSDPRRAGEIRSRELLRAALAAPRERNLAPVLSTLQPDQYGLVTRPAMSSIVIEGQPGTGKTIIAAHRAAYMVDLETPVENTLDGDVLLVGPTSEYSQQVLPLITRLTGGSERVKTIAIPDLLALLIGVREEFRGRTSRTWQDVDARLWRLAWSAHAAVVRQAGNGHFVSVERVYEYLRSNGVATHPLARDPEWSSYLATLPRFGDAQFLRAHAPLLANIAWLVAPPPGLRNIEHVIVDEAQDVTPLEWTLLNAINQTTAWTLLGDLNQRRSDHTCSSWQQIAEVIEHSEGIDGLPVSRLELGYRSTKAILDFANQLLPRTERRLLAFQQEGPIPALRRVRESELADVALEEVERLLAAYPQGTVAVIGVDPTRVRIRFRAAGWQADRGNQRRWVKAGRVVTVVHPDVARGLEFDGVVVVEPSAFPQNYGRQGPLYTSLTRPNRELAVVHSAALPEALRVKK